MYRSAKASTTPTMIETNTNNIGDDIE
ncbi:hypothetical protein PBCVCZ2_344R [Paramecium bursaria Chlorella virus CZ-2]|nr:hypothetical protein PBCVCZ2_344R [Paramecium bursaria Chlorella virus CZ-2]